VAGRTKEGTGGRRRTWPDDEGWTLLDGGIKCPLQFITSYMSSGCERGTRGLTDTRALIHKGRVGRSGTRRRGRLQDWFIITIPPSKLVWGGQGERDDERGSSNLTRVRPGAFLGPAATVRSGTPRMPREDRKFSPQSETRANEGEGGDCRDVTRGHASDDAAVSFGQPPREEEVEAL
jgi:hypothetical protein